MTSKFTLSESAKFDLTEIYSYSRSNFGKPQAVRYTSELKKRVSLLAANPYIGRAIEGVEGGYFQYEYISHSIYYRIRENDILIIRILHNRRDSENLLN